MFPERGKYHLDMQNLFPHCALPELPKPTSLCIIQFIPFNSLLYPTSMNPSRTGLGPRRLRSLPPPCTSSGAPRWRPLSAGPPADPGRGRPSPSSQETFCLNRVNSTATAKLKWSRIWFLRSAELFLRKLNNTSIEKVQTMNVVFYARFRKIGLAFNQYQFARCFQFALCPCAVRCN